MGQWVYNATAEVNALSQYPTILAVCITLTVLMSVVVGLRIWTRTSIVKSTGPDDWVILSSMVCSIIYNALCITQTRYGLGLPLWARPIEDLDRYATANFAGRPFYMTGITGFKVALCFAYLRLTSRSYSKKIFTYRNIIWIMMAFSILTHLGGTLVLLFQCDPIKKSWRPRTEGHCLKNGITFYVLASLTIICDVIIFTLPIPLLCRLEINKRKKIGLISMFALGLFTTFCSIMRMAQIRLIAKDGNSTKLILWGTIEMNVGITLTCLPALVPLVAYIREQTLVASERFHGYQKSGAGTDRRSSTVKNTVQVTRKPHDFNPGSTGFHTTTITADRPSRDWHKNIHSSKKTLFSSGGRTEVESFSDRPHSLVMENGFITRTTEVIIHLEDMSQEEVKLGLR